MALGNTYSEQIQKAISIEKYKDELVTMAENFFNNHKNKQETDNSKYVVPVKRNQFENLLSLSVSTTSVNEVINFIRYQIGRENGWRGGFGESLITEINEVVKLDKSVSIELVRLFLGYCTRHGRYIGFKD